MQLPLVLQTFFFREETIDIYVPDAMAVREAYVKGAISFPYWSRVWPAAKALAQFLVQHPHYIIAKKVMEIGAGLGLPSLLAARQAAYVHCTDMVAEAVAAARLSAVQLGLQNFTADVVDWQQLPSSPEADVLLLSDINYEPAAFGTVQKLIAAFLEKGTTVLLSTPQRLMAKDFIAPLLAHCLQQEELAVVHEGKNVQITVVVLQQKRVL